MEEFDEATAARLFEELEKRPVELHLQGYSAWVLLSAIQLAWRHPDIGEGLKGRLEKMGRTIQKTWIDVPWVEALAEKGWHREYDVPTSREEGDNDMFQCQRCGASAVRPPIVLFAGEGPNDPEMTATELCLACASLVSGHTITRVKD